MKTLKIVCRETEDRGRLDTQEISETTDGNTSLYFEVQDLTEYPEDALIGNELFDADDYVEALNNGIKLAKEGYDNVEVEHVLMNKIKRLPDLATIFSDFLDNFGIEIPRDYVEKKYGLLNEQWNDQLNWWMGEHILPSDSDFLEYIGQTIDILEDYMDENNLSLTGVREDVHIVDEDYFFLEEEIKKGFY